MMNFGEIFSKSWKIIWKNKILWIFGIFAAMLNGGGSGASIANGNSGVNYTTSGNDWQGMFPRFEQFSYRAERFFSNINEGAWLGLAIGVTCFVLLWIVLSVFLGNVGKAALIKGVVHSDEDSTVKLKFGPLFKEGTSYFWQLFVLQLLTAAAVFVAVIAGIILSVVTLGIGAILLLCLAIPLAIAVGLLLRQTNIFIVAEDMPMMDALKASWNFVFEKNLGNYILMALIVGVGGWFISLLMALPILMVLVPVTAGLIISEGAMMGAGLLIGIGIFFLIYIPFAILGNGILTAYVQSVWTLTYRELRFKKGEEDLTPLELQSSLPDDGVMD